MAWGRGLLERMQHPESKSLATDGSPSVAITHGLLRRRPIHDLAPFRLIAKEIDGSIQDDYAVFSDSKPLEYCAPQGGNAAMPLGDNHFIAKLLEQTIQGHVHERIR
jgi:hypothetical protein